MKTIIPVFALLAALTAAAQTAPSLPSPAPEPPPIKNDSDSGAAPAVEPAARARSKKARAAADKELRRVEPKPPLNDENENQDFNLKLFEGGAANMMAMDGFVPPGRGSSQPLVVRTGELDAAALANIQEDLSVMSRIITRTVDREIGHDAHDLAMGIVISTLPGSRRPQSLYLEGYGAVFLVNVKFPLVPPPAKEDEKNDKAQDSTWERTKQELYGPRTGTSRIWTVNQGSEPATEFDADQVEGLKNELVDSLKNAANIRNLRPEEYVTITVIGTRASSAGNRVKHAVPRKENAGRKADVFMWADSGRGTVRETMLNLRAKKADVDAFAKGGIDAEAFKKRVAIAAY